MYYPCSCQSCIKPRWTSHSLALPSSFSPGVLFFLQARVLHHRPGRWLSLAVHKQFALLHRELKCWSWELLQTFCFKVAHIGSEISHVVEVGGGNSDEMLGAGCKPRCRWILWFCHNKNDMREEQKGVEKETAGFWQWSSEYDDQYFSVRPVVYQK